MVTKTNIICLKQLFDMNQLYGILCTVPLHFTLICTCDESVQNNYLNWITSGAYLSGIDHRRSSVDNHAVIIIKLLQNCHDITLYCLSAVTLHLNVLSCLVCLHCRHYIVSSDLICFSVNRSHDMTTFYSMCCSNNGIHDTLHLAALNDSCNVYFNTSY